MLLEYPPGGGRTNGGGIGVFIIGVIVLSLRGAKTWTEGCQTLTARRIVEFV